MEQPPNKETFDFTKSPMRELYMELGAKTPLELHNAYVELEQPLFISMEWDYDNADQPQNKVKEMLESLDTSGLTEDEREWRNETLWFWYHHAISVANSKRNKEKLKFFSEKAVELQGDDHPNMLTRTMYLLAHDRLEEAEAWVESKQDDPEENIALDAETAREIVTAYKATGWLG